MAELAAVSPLDIVELFIEPLPIEPLVIVPGVPDVFRFEPLGVVVLLFAVAFCCSIVDWVMAVVSVMPEALVPLVPLTTVVLFVVPVIDAARGSGAVPVALVELRFVEPAAAVPLFIEDDIEPLFVVAVVDVAAVLPLAGLFGLLAFEL